MANRLFQFDEGTTLDLTSVMMVSRIFCGGIKEQRYKLYFNDGTSMTVFEHSKDCNGEPLRQAHRVDFVAAWEAALAEHKPNQ